jgi:hypothetical protein
MVGAAGIEPATLGLEIRCSVLLSYAPILLIQKVTRSHFRLFPIVCGAFSGEFLSHCPATGAFVVNAIAIVIGIGSFIVYALTGIF